MSLANIRQLEFKTGENNGLMPNHVPRAKVLFLVTACKSEHSPQV